MSVSGLLLVDKPIGLTSHDVVQRLRRLLETKEVGHSGTLDPMASGLMVILVGEGTKLSPFVTEGDKSYQVGVKLGLITDTLDITGKVLSEKPVLQTMQEVQSLALALHGEMILPIPMYSAKKIEGKKLYEYARSGIEVEQPSKSMKFWSISSEQTNDIGFNDDLILSLSCSKGSFVRSWVSLLGEKLGCGAVMSKLVRTKSHAFDLSDAISLSGLESLSLSERLSRLLPLDQALMGIKRIRVRGQDAVLMRNGQISHQLRVQLITQFEPGRDQIIQILPEERGRILAVIGLEKDQGFKIKRVFNC